MAAAKSLDKIRNQCTEHTNHTVSSVFFSKKFRLIREIRVPTGFIPDFAQVMLFIRRSLEDG